ncbi:BZ3500_MvSof-1268-A1-R1_Chr6-3g08721 [Microbotryum saponariae]|uniref:BZ3500_MvSof-1268-A1-R1_Chr6-3g08721 protein n=1 Tax=Microbotryum saponariae TaxID=289078 RepID=A0A2X0KIS8_9BASI|nr:BZ3500_MvSof-1268-A1-R1_Chr6-3g08721 [Microbotryum saponariae]SDA07322.1 BZ3501_MvSof-1269-A2-R1_Chr6-2g08424 [Microbotryum saponariae]
MSLHILHAAHGRFGLFYAAPYFIVVELGESGPCLANADSARSCGTQTFDEQSTDIANFGHGWEGVPLVRHLGLC